MYLVMRPRNREVKSKIVDNINYVDPGHLSPPERKTSVPATVHPISGTVPGVTVADLWKLKVNFDTEDQDLDVEVQIKSSEGSDESTETSFNAITPAIVPDPQPKLVDGFQLSDLERLRKKQLISDVLQAQEKIKFWSKREKDAKQELKQLEVKEQRVREKALENQLSEEQSQRKALESKIRELEARLSTKSGNIAESLDMGDIFKYGGISFGDEFNFEE